MPSLLAIRRRHHCLLPFFLACFLFLQEGGLTTFVAVAVAPVFTVCDPEPIASQLNI